MRRARTSGFYKSESSCKILSVIRFREARHRLSSLRESEGLAFLSRFSALRCEEIEEYVPAKCYRLQRRMWRWMCRCLISDFGF